MKALFNIVRNMLALVGLAAIVFLGYTWSLFIPVAWFNEEKVELRLSSPHKE